VIGDVPSGYLCWKEGSITPAGKHLIGMIISSGKRVSDFFSPFGSCELEYRPAAQLFKRATEQCAGSSICVNNYPLLADNDSFGCDACKQSEALLALAQRGFGLQAILFTANPLRHERIRS
jgi:hypothetical protein